ncbi:MAG: tetratricopeptide repeat protein, partial [Phycisphaerae bacterium]
MAQLTIQQAFDLAMQHHQAGRLQEAEQLYRQILMQQPGHADALHLRGVIASQVGRHDLAVVLIRQAIALKPGYTDAYSNLGIALCGLGQLGEAIAAFRQAILLNPNDAETLSNLGNALRDGGQLDEAIVVYRQAIARKPDWPDIYSSLGFVLTDVGQLDEAIAAFRQALALNPGYATAHSNLLLTMHYHPGFAASAIAEEHRRWNRVHAEPLQKYIQAHANDRSPERRLRIGYVSPDLREHVNGRNFLTLLAGHDHANFEIFAYAQVPKPDGLSEEIRAQADSWRSLVELTDVQAAELIRQDKIDILVDLAGHTAGNRLLVFALQPAPVQVTWLGYPNTTGLRTMDYRLTDAYADPPGQTESYHSEQLSRLSPCAWCYRATQSPPLTTRPEGPVTFGSFNTFPKVSEPMLRLWGRILRVVPESRLLLKAMGLGSESTRVRVRQVLGQEGIAAERLELRGFEPGHGGHLALYSRMDVALDTFPYHGTNTTCEALWMGVPVVSLAGESHVSRGGVSLLRNG